MKTLYLPLKKEWYEMIERGEKREEYREQSHYWKARLITCYHCGSWCDAVDVDNYGKMCDGCHRWPVFTTFDAVCFSYGYTKRRMLFECKGITLGQGRKEWGAPDHETFIIKLGGRIQ